MVKHSLKRTSVTDRLFTARSGSQAVEYLSKSLNSPLDLIPSLLIIDLDSAGANGLYVLQRVRSDLQIADMRVAILTEPLDERDSEYFEKLDLDLILEKPLEHKIIQEVFENLAQELNEPVVPETVEKVAPPFRAIHSAPDLFLDNLESRKVLIVERSNHDRNHMSHRLSQGVNSTLTFELSNSWKSARQQLKSQSYSLVVVGLSGLEDASIEEIVTTCRDRSNCSIIAVVDSADEVLGKTAVLAGASLYVVRDSGNYLSILAELVFNMVERRRLEGVARKGLDADKELLKEVIERAPLMMLRIDRSFSIRDCNDAFSKTSKRLRHSLIGRHIFDILPDLEVLPMIAVLDDGIPYSREGFRMKAVGHSHSASTYWDFHVWPIKNSLAAAQEAILIAADVSERIELEQQRERFVAALAHDIRNPLVGGQRVLDALLSGKHGALEPPRAKQLMSTLQKSNQNLLLMLSNLIDVYKFESAEMTLQFKAVDLAAVVVEQIRDITHIAASSDITIEQDIEESLPRIAGDINSVRRLLMNLLHNALKYAAANTTIRVRVYSVATLVCFKISNDGSPISADKMRNLFKNIVDGVPIKHGSGLGLHLCRKIAEAHGATMECTSSGQTGTTFNVRFRSQDSGMAHDERDAAV